MNKTVNNFISKIASRAVNAAKPVVKEEVRKTIRDNVTPILKLAVAITPIVAIGCASKPVRTNTPTVVCHQVYIFNLNV